VIFVLDAGGGEHESNNLSAAAQREVRQLVVGRRRLYTAEVCNIINIIIIIVTVTVSLSRLLVDGLSCSHM